MVLFIQIRWYKEDRNPQGSIVRKNYLKPVMLKPESYKQDFVIMVPQNEEWGKLIEMCYGDRAKKVTRYAIKKEKDIFDVSKLEQAVWNLPLGYELK